MELLHIDLDHGAQIQFFIPYVRLWDLLLVVLVYIIPLLQTTVGTIEEVTVSAWNGI